MRAYPSRCSGVCSGRWTSIAHRPEMAQMGHVRFEAAHPEAQRARVRQRRDPAGVANQAQSLPSVSSS